MGKCSPRSLVLHSFVMMHIIVDEMFEPFELKCCCRYFLNLLLVSLLLVSRVFNVPFGVVVFFRPLSVAVILGMLLGGTGDSSSFGFLPVHVTYPFSC